ncbi:MAG: phosphate ABC transporter permease subunit PstC [Paludibacteraceae bacterium]|nr:phosphate ABC transporter permease subunit PstC [Paludibacteraceae bacterium]
MRKTTEKIVEGVLFSSSTVTTVAVLFIIFFLFKSGIGLFQDSPVEKNYAIALNANNPVKNLSAKQIKDIFNGDITNWKQVGGKDGDIELFTLNELGSAYTEEQIGSNLEHIPTCLNEYVKQHENVITYFDKKFYPRNFQGKVLDIPKISVIDFLLGKEWYPTSTPAALFGVLPLIIGTLFVTFFAILFALPIGLITAVYMAEIANERTRRFLKPVIELLAGIPSVVYGFFGLVVLVPLIQQTFNLPVGETALAGSLILGIMALPTIITISEDAIRTTPIVLKEASLGLGATHWQTLLRVTLPYARSGIMAAFILGIGRAVGETMAVLMVTGNAAIMPHSLLAPVRTIPATIAAELGEAPMGGTHFKALFALGIILFIITFVFNSLVEVVKSKKEK